MLSIRMGHLGQRVHMPPRPLDRRHRQLLLDFGDRVRATRKALGWSQETLAHNAGLHRTYIGHIERGESNLTLTNIVLIAETLQIDPADLLNGLKTTPH